MTTQPVDRMKTKLAMKRRDIVAMVNRSNKTMLPNVQPLKCRLEPKFGAWTWYFLR